MVNKTADWTVSDYEAGLLNGSESMMIEFSRALSVAGHSVRVFCSCDGTRYMDFLFNHDTSIDYYDLKYLDNAKNEGVLIAFKNPESLMLHGFKQKYMWTADPNRLTVEQRRECDGLFAISKFHERELKGLNIGYRDIGHIEPGVVREAMFHVKPINRQCLYASSPDRGLDYLLDIWPEIEERVPGVTLVTTYSADKRRSNMEMLELYQSSDVLAYPCNGGERFCITAIKAQMHGTIPCVIPTMALQDTVQFGIKSLKDKYLGDIVKLLLDDDRRAKIRADMIKGVKFNSWADVVAKWEKIIGKEEKQESQGKH